MNVVCMVPSWTETLIHAGVNVVGRTRYCIHPRERVASIPVVGGTKDISWSKVAELKADLLVLDKEENPRFMAEQSPVPWIATHVTSVWDVEKNLQVIHERLLRPELVAMGKRWRDVCERLTRESRNPSWLKLPGVIEWVRQPRVDVDRFLYIIWKDPWTAVDLSTFIGSVFSLLGFGSRMSRLNEKYARIRLEDFDPIRTLLLFGSEPYPFDKRKEVIEELPHPSAIVDGECFSWFGVRTLRFLEERCR